MKITGKSVLEKRMLICVISLIAIYSINSLIISPLTGVISNDIVYSDTLIPTLLGFLSELLELCAIAVCYSVMITVIYDFGKKHVRPVFLIFCSTTAYKYAANMLVFWGISGSIPNLWAWDVVNVFYFTALELLQLFIVYIIINTVIGGYVDRRTALERAMQKAGECHEGAIREVYPFKKIYDRENCILRSIFFCALVTFIAKFCGTLFSDIWLIITCGLPSEPRTWLLMILSYVSKIIFGTIVYFVMYVSVSKLLQKK